MGFFWAKFVTKDSYFQSKTDKIDRHHHWILHIRFILCIEFYFEQTILNFWTKFTQERYWSSKTEKVNIFVESCILKLVFVPNFNLNWQFWYFHQICPKWDFLVENRKSEHLFSTYFCIFKLVYREISAQTDNFDFLDQICQKRYF